MAKSGIIRIPRIPEALAVSPVLPLPLYDVMQTRWQLSPCLVVDQETWLIVNANRPAEELFGRNLGELEGVSVHDLVPDALRARHAEHVETFKSEPYRTARPMGQGLVVTGRHSKGYEIPCNVALYRFARGGKKYVLAEITDQRTGEAHPVPDSQGVEARIPTMPPAPDEKQREDNNRGYG